MRTRMMARTGTLETCFVWRTGLLCFITLFAAGIGPLTSAQVSNELSAADLEARVSEIFGRSCTLVGCHVGPTPQMDMYLTPDRFYASLVDQTSRERPEFKLVDPGRPESSYLLMKLTGESDIIGSPMPLTGDRLSVDEVELVKAWIRGIESVDQARIDATPDADVFPFHGWKAINLPTTRTIDRGSWLFLISHRFNPPVSSGSRTLYGLDGSGIIFLSMGYAFTDKLFVSLGRSNSADNVELWSRYRIRGHNDGGLPIGLSVQSSVNWVTETPTVADVFSSEALKWTLQVPVSGEVAGGLGVIVVPGVTLNPVEAVQGEDPLITLGLASQWNFYRNLSLVAEWVPIVSGYTRSNTFGNDIRFDTWSGAFQISTGRHVFQIVASNSVGLSSDQYLRGGDLDIRDADFRLGFNIFRVINF